MGADFTSGMTLPDWTAVAHAYGIKSYSIAEPNGLRELIRTVLSDSDPIVCEVKVFANEERVPRVASAVQSDGSMSSRPLEDLYPFLSREELKQNMLIPLI